IEPKHYNAVGKVMGGVMFTLADFAFAVLANHKMENPCVSQTSTITFLGGVKGKKVIAKAHYIKNGRSVAVASIDVTDELNTQVATVIISGQKLGK
ncbi:MAG: PaaI family thioesterase, partial [Holdemanella sp.]|nr:PaaI family thioesterase [Holdemanella sp.]